MSELENKEKNDTSLKLIFKVSFFFLILALLFPLGSKLYLAKVQARNDAKYQKVLTQLEETRAIERARKLEEKKKYLQTTKIAEETIEDHIPPTGKYIAADLDHMKLFLYEDGKFLKEYPIQSKGKPGSFWETPSGDYQIMNKIPRHYSSVGEVYMPWSMQFYGNFFIHGWPYYPDGTDVPAGYSGGCIRLSTKDAEAVYKFAERNTPIFVYERSDPNPSPQSILKHKNIPPPEVTALAYIIADVNTGEVFLEKNTNLPLSIASLTKLMTAIVTNEVIMFDRKITITKEAVAVYGDSGNLEEGEIMTANDILYPLLMESSNDAAKAIALHYGEYGFISLMNKKARALGMKNTIFADTSGISETNISTVYDLYLLSKYLKNKKSFILKISKLPEKELRSSLLTHTFHNFNIFSEDPSFLGGKTGYTKAAKETMIALFEIPIRDEAHNIAFIVLQSDNREKDIQAMVSWFKNTIIEQTSTTSPATL